MKKSYWLGLIVIVLFLALGARSFNKSLTPYVSVAESRKSAEAVQVAGDLVKSSIYYNIRTGELRFNIRDKTGTLPVVYKKERPGNFDQANRVVVNGTYDSRQHCFFAEQLLVKCPSKYQGADETK